MMVWCMIAIFAFLQPALAYTYFSEEPGSCQIIGDADVYGIGIRLGFYLQYISVVLCIIFDRIEDLKAARQGFNAFSLAALINLYRNATKTLPIEWYICIYLVLSIPWAAGPRSKADFNNSYSTLLIQNRLYISILLANLWLAYHGMQIGHKPGCDLRAFYVLGPYSLYTPSALSGAKFGSIIGVILVPIFFIYPMNLVVYPFAVVATETPSGRHTYRQGGTRLQHFLGVVQVQSNYGRQNHERQNHKHVLFFFFGPFSIVCVWR
ncbi:hypothetical protein L207DRAFT_517551 [Hyaloscypha variabilis F]|uniref:Uncharacterized protein n=1 Tax=Hyaloscypha variabilis (strain UAMH 11265 / GT02V1 / F) TaxID=1149755 RepID=A0A2J6R7A3_HYAVF|nr:hypothetical protein L207DRAFT_517551 [Hyaloscypha variabilis F]